MGRLSKGCLALAAAAAAAAIGTNVYAAEPTYDELKQQLDQLKSRLDQLETRQAVSAQEVDKTVERVLQDADHRSQLLQAEGFTAGWTKDKGFRVQDAAGNWVLHPYFQFQFRSTTNWRNDGKHGGNDNDWENGFSIPRMKIGFDGNAFSPNLTYNFLWNSSTTTGGLNLEQAWVKYMLADGWFVRGGQIINPAFHEQTMGSKYLAAVDRSLVNSLITGTNEARTQAITLIHDEKGSPIWAEAGIEDGFNSQNTDFRDPNEGGTNDWGVTGRVNYFVNGDAKQYNDFSAIGNKNDLLVIGAGGDITQTGDVTNYLHVVDVQWENTSGLGLYAAYLGNYIDNNGTDDTFYNWGFLVQANYLINDRWEVFARYDLTKFDEDVVSSGEGDEFCELTGGFTWFAFGGHNGKFTVDLTWLPNGVPSTPDLSGLGFLPGGDDQVVLRAQFQLLL